MLVKNKKKQILYARNEKNAFAKILAKRSPRANGKLVLYFSK
jgi:hypothetical protein